MKLPYSLRVFGPVSALVVSGLLLCVTLAYPYSIDNAVYAYMAGLTLHGQLPYLGSWDNNFPGVILIHLAQILTLGRSALAFHAFDVGIQLVGVWLVYRICSIFQSERAGWLAAVLSAAYYVHYGHMLAGQRDVYVSVLLLAALDHSLKDPNRFAAVALFAGLSVLMRPTCGIFVFAFLLIQPESLRDLKHRISYLVIASVPLLLAVSLYAMLGGLDDWYQATILFNTSVYNRTGPFLAVFGLFTLYWNLVIPAVVWIVISRNSPHTRAVIVLLLAGLVNVYFLTRSPYQYQPVMAVLIMLAACGYDRLVEMWLKKGRSHFRGFALSLPTLLIATFISFSWLRGTTMSIFAKDLLKGKISDALTAQSYFDDDPEIGWRIQDSVGRYLRAHTKQGDRIQMFGQIQYPVFLSTRQTASRFTMIHGIAQKPRVGRRRGFQERWRNEYVIAITQTRPVYFVVADGPDAARVFLSGRIGHEIIEDYPSLKSWLNSAYELETVIGLFTLYRLKD